MLAAPVRAAARPRAASAGARRRAPPLCAGEDGSGTRRRPNGRGRPRRTIENPSGVGSRRSQTGDASPAVGQDVSSASGMSVEEMYASLGVEDEPGKDRLWRAIRQEAKRDSEKEPALASFLYSTILAQSSLEDALSFHMANKLSSPTLLSTHLFELFRAAMDEDPTIGKAVRADILAVAERDPACCSFSQALLYFKGFIALEVHRVAHRLWQTGRRPLALALQSRVSENFHVDFHPAACIGSGLLLDHATGIVVGETAVVGDNCSMLHHVTLGGTGSAGGDRHPKIGDCVLIGASSTLLGPIEVGCGAKIGAGSVVLTDVPAYTTFVGVPARQLGEAKPPTSQPGTEMDQTSYVEEFERNGWDDWVI